MYNVLVHYTYMPQVSQNKLDKKQEQELLKTFHLILAHISRVEDMQQFLLSFLTPTEQVMLAKRLAVVLMLKQGNSDTEISQALHITRMTVSKLRYLVEARPESFDITNRVLQNEELRLAIKQILLDLGSYAARAAGGRVKSTIF